MVPKLFRKLASNPKNENKNERRFIFVIQSITIIACLLFLFIDTGTSVLTQPILIIYIILSVISLLLAYWNDLQPARIIIPIAGFITITVLLYKGGIHDDALGGYYFLLVFAAFLLGRPGVLTFGLLNTIAIIFIGYAETSGLITTHFAPLTDPSTIFSTAFFMLATTLTMDYFVNHLKRIIVIAHRNEQKQITTNRELNTLKTILESRVKERTAELQALFTAMQDIVVVFDKEGRYLNIANTGSKLHIEPPEDLLGKTIHDVFPKREADRRVAHIRKVIRTQRTLHAEYFVENDDRHPWFDATVSPMSKETAIWVSHDITERKQAEAALQESEARFRAVLENSLDASYKRNLQTNTYDYLSPVFVHIGGYSSEEMKALPIETVMGLIHPDDVPEVDRVLAKAISMPTGSSHQVDYRFKHKADGKYHWLHDQFVIMPDAQGRPVSMIGSVSDITERKKNELIQKAIYRITEAAIAEKGINTLYQSIHSIIGELIPADNFYIALFDAATNLISFPYYVDQYDQAPTEPTPIEGFTGYVLRTGQPLLANQEVADRLIQQGEVEAVGTMGEDWMGTPLKLGEHIIGVMAVQSYSKTTHFNDEDLKFFEFVSSQVAQAIDRKQQESKSFFIGTHDQLTGLYNRTFFEEELSRLDKSRLFPISILMIDVDKLKNENDSRGHSAGDAILRRTAQVLTQSFRPEDMVARIGGDEFIAILPRTTGETAKLALERINHFLELNNKNNQINIKISIGRATCDQQGSLVDTVKEADDQMYLDKRSKT